MDINKIHITPEILQLIAEIDSFKGRWVAVDSMSPERLSSLKRQASIESVGSSTRIEGAILSDSEVEALLSRLSTTSFLSRDEQEVAGYAEAMDLVFESHEDMPLTENHIRQLHKIMLHYSERDERHRGSYKTLPNHVVARDSSGAELGVVFTTATPLETPQLMTDLVRRTTTALDESAHHPLVIIGAFIVEFLAIHPFQDGNGRLSRILTTLLLLRSGYIYVPYASLESVVEKNKEFYYKALRRSQASLATDNPDVNPWLGFFLRSLKKQKDLLDSKVREPAVPFGEEELPRLSVQIVSEIRQHGRRSIAEIVSATGANRNTIKAHLRRLSQDGRIRQFGKGRGTWYAI